MKLSDRGKIGDTAFFMTIPQNFETSLIDNFYRNRFHCNIHGRLSNSKNKTNMER